jgi:hypothetical protein
VPLIQGYKFEKKACADFIRWTTGKLFAAESEYIVYAYGVFIIWPTFSTRPAIAKLKYKKIAFAQYRISPEASHYTQYLSDSTLSITNV